jgi:hypothetical protein
MNYKPLSLSFFLILISFSSFAQLGSNTDTTIASVDSSENKVFDKPEKEASFPGGNQGWRSYLERNVNGMVASDNGAPSGYYTVIVQFIVDKEGNISNVKALTNHGYGMENEVVRIITLGPKWLPALYNGKVVKAYRKQPVTFVVTNEPKSKNKKNKDRI